LERNFRAAGAEIDLTAADHETLVFVEAKARSNAAFGVPADDVDARESESHPACRLDVSAPQSRGGADRALRRRSDYRRAGRLELLKDAF
jgi:hypothetical protein